MFKKNNENTTYNVTLFLSITSENSFLEEIDKLIQYEGLFKIICPKKWQF